MLLNALGFHRSFRRWRLSHMWGGRLQCHVLCEISDVDKRSRVCPARSRRRIKEYSDQDANQTLDTRRKCKRKTYTYCYSASRKAWGWRNGSGHQGHRHNRSGYIRRNFRDGSAFRGRLRLETYPGDEGDASPDGVPAEGGLSQWRMRGTPELTEKKRLKTE